jgi:solute carrier family 25 (mitochondrial S-adenosylmethionine transporter), member 26
MESGLITVTRAESAGSVAAVTNTSVDVVKTRIMLSAAGNDSCADTAKKVERAWGE